MIAPSEIEARIARVKALPVAVIEMRRALSDPKSSLVTFERILSRDPGLCANALRVANSAAFGLSRRVVDLGQAVSLLGVARLEELVMSAGLSTVLPERLEGYATTSAGFLEHSLVVAMLSRRLAERNEPRQASSAYVAGLLHDIGKLVISGFLRDEPEVARSLESGAGLCFVDAERQAFGSDHAEIGSAIAARWKLPELIVDAIRGHHHPALVELEAHRAVARFVHVANGLAHMVGVGADVGGMHRRIEDEVLAQVGLSGHQRELFLADSVDALNELRQQVHSSAGAGK